MFHEMDRHAHTSVLLFYHFSVIISNHSWSTGRVGHVNALPLDEPSSIEVKDDRFASFT